jgi:hypothetical protein
MLSICKFYVTHAVPVLKINTSTNLCTWSINYFLACFLCVKSWINPLTITQSTFSVSLCFRSFINHRNYLEQSAKGKQYIKRPSKITLCLLHWLITMMMMQLQQRMMMMVMMRLQQSKFKWRRFSPIRTSEHALQFSLCSGTYTSINGGEREKRQNGYAWFWARRDKDFLRLSSSFISF